MASSLSPIRHRSLPTVSCRARTTWWATPLRGDGGRAPDMALTTRERQVRAKRMIAEAAAADEARTRRASPGNKSRSPRPRSPTSAQNGRSVVGPSVQTGVTRPVEGVPLAAPRLTGLPLLISMLLPAEKRQARVTTLRRAALAGVMATTMHSLATVLTWTRSRCEAHAMRLAAAAPRTGSTDARTAGVMRRYLRRADGPMDGPWLRTASGNQALSLGGMERVLDGRSPRVRARSGVVLRLREGRRARVRGRYVRV